MLLSPVRVQLPSRIRAGSAQACRAGTERKDNMELNGADIVVRCLAEEGVEHVFGYTLAARCFTSDAIFSSRTNSSTFWCVTSRLPCTPPTRTRAPRRKWAYAW